jgi:F0F1-type ATP synthase assembly protein I
MHFPPVNYLAVLAAGIVIFVLGGLWYSPVLFAKRWTALQGRTEEQMRAQAASSNMPVMYVSAFICGLVTAWVLAMLLAHIDSTYNLVSFVIAGIILAVWR